MRPNRMIFSPGVSDNAFLIFFTGSGSIPRLGPFLFSQGDTDRCGFIQRFLCAARRV